MTTQELNKLLADYAKQDLFIKAEEKKLAALKKEITDYMESEGVGELLSDEHKALYKLVESARFDTTAFKQEDPDTYYRYLKVSSSKRFNFA